MTVFPSQAGWFTTLCVIAAVVLYVGFVSIGYPGRIARMYSVKIPEARPFNTIRAFKAFLGHVGEDGVRLYRQQLAWDIVFAVLFAPPMVAILDATWAANLGNRSWLRILIFVPLIMLVADVLEDVLLLRMTSKGHIKIANVADGKHEAIVKEPHVEIRTLGTFAAAQAMTVIKFVSVAAALGLILGGCVRKVVDSGSVPQPSPPTSTFRVSFDYSMADRLADSNGDGIVDYLTPDQIRAKEFAVTLDGCASTGPIIEFDWTVQEASGDKVQREVGSCRLVLQLPEGTDPVQLTVRYQDGSDARTQHDIEVKDWVIVSMGDSFASGQGAPDVDRHLWHAAVWKDKACNRSSLAGATQAALKIERDDPRTSVTLVHVACSGATVKRGLLFPQDAGDGPSKDLSQVRQIEDLVGDRRIDALIVSIGGNDIGFGDIIKRCLLHHCGSISDDRRFEARLTTLTGGGSSGYGIPELFSCMTSESCRPGLSGLAVSPGTIFATTYPDLTSRIVAGRRITCHYGSITSVEFGWARRRVLTRLNAGVTEAWNERGSHVISLDSSLWEHHGICAGKQRWIRTVVDSYRYQGGRNGAFHPTHEGYAEGYAPAIVRALRESDIGVPASAFGGMT